MDQITLSTNFELYTPDPQSTTTTTSTSTTTRPVSSPDPEARGRKRRRDPLNLSSLQRQHNTARAESSTLRGRCRHRSPSRLAIMTSMSSHPGTGPGNAAGQDPPASPTSSPETRRFLSVIMAWPENHRRSQSPSRSRSRGGGRTKAELFPLAMTARRRQRTQSRSRRHGREEAFATVRSSPRSPLGFGGWAVEETAKAQD